MSMQMTNDPLIDEVRRIRSDIAERCGHDLDKLGQEFHRVEQDYAERRGVFAGVTAEAAARVEASWGNLTGPAEDPVIDEVRAIRRGPGTMPRG